MKLVGWIGGVLLLLQFLLAGCSEEQVSGDSPLASIENADSNLQALPGEGALNEPSPDSLDEYEWYYVVMLDSSKSYDRLADQMVQLSNHTGVGIDTMGRSFDQQKEKLVIMPGEDEMYEGEYLPKRFESNELSIEYLNAYHQEGNSETMVLIAGLFSEPNEAEVQLNKFKVHCPKAFVHRSRMYLGCVH